MKDVVWTLLAYALFAFLVYVFFVHQFIRSIKG